MLYNEPYPSSDPASLIHMDTPEVFTQKTQTYLAENKNCVYVLCIVFSSRFSSMESTI